MPQGRKIEMKKIAQKALDDLEFGVVLEQAAMRCATALGKEQMMTSVPSSDVNEVTKALLRTNEYAISFSEEKPIPNHGFDDVSEEISTAAHEQQHVSEEISKRLESIVSIAEQTAEGANQTSISSTEVAKLAEELRLSVDQFKV